MTLLEAINRKSTVKVFQNRRVGDEIFRGILKFSETLQLPFSPDDVNLEVLDSCGEIRKQMGVKAPYFLFIYTKNPENGSLNAGFAAEQLSLYLWTKGLGSRILGFRNDLPGADRRGGYPGTVLAFGWPQSREEMVFGRKGGFEDQKEGKGWISAVLEQAGIPDGQKKLGNLRLDISQGGIDCYRRRHFFEQKTKSLQDSFEAGRILAHIFVAAEELWLRLEVISDMEKNRRGERDEYLLTIQEKETAAGRAGGKRVAYPASAAETKEYLTGSAAYQREAAGIRRREGQTGRRNHIPQGAAAQRA